MNCSPRCSARRRRYSSNICFQAAACTFAVCVSTPSRSNRHARIAPGSPSVGSTPLSEALEKREDALLEQDGGVFVVVVDAVVREQMTVAGIEEELGAL